MRTDTQQLRRAEEELSRQNKTMNRIMLRAEEIQRWMKQYDSLEDMAYHLRIWSEGMENSQRGMLQLTLALDNIARLYESNERDIVNNAEAPVRPAYVFKVDAVRVQSLEQTVGMQYSDILQAFGGERVED